MQAAANFICDNLEALAGDNDPGAILDAYPRELVTQGEAAAPLVNALWERLERDARLPDCNGEFRPARALRRPPVDAADLGLAWSRLADDDACAYHLHPGCAATPARSGRLDQLTRRLAATPSSVPGEPTLQRTPAEAWLEHAATSDPDEARAVLALADAFAKASPGFAWDQIRDRLRVIPAADGEMLASPEATLSADGGEPLRPVHPLLVSDADARRILEARFHLRDAAETDWERLLEARVDVAGSTGDWTDVWKLLRRMPWNAIDETLDWATIHVRARTGWVEPDRCVRAGALLLETDLDALDDQRQPLVAAWMIDENFHRQDTAILTRLGVTEALQTDWDEDWSVLPKTDSVSAAWLTRWREKWTEEYYVSLDRRPDRSRLGPSGFKLPRGWELLVLLDGDSRRRITAHLLNAVEHASAKALAGVSFSHRSRPGSWDTRIYPHPLWALMLERGELAVGVGEIDFGSLLIKSVGEKALMLPALARWAPALGKLQASGATYISARGISQIWKAWLELATLVPHGGDLTALWETAAADGVAPRQVPGKEGPVDLSEVLVARMRRDADAASEAGQVSVVLTRDAGMVWVRNGARWLDDVAGVHWTSGESGEEALLLVEVEPALAEVLSEDAQKRGAVLFVGALETRFGGCRARLTGSAKPTESSCSNPLIGADLGGIGSLSCSKPPPQVVGSPWMQRWSEF